MAANAGGPAAVEEDDDEHGRPPQDEQGECDREEAERQRNYEYLQWRRDLDHMKRQHEGVVAQSDKMKAQGNQFFSLGCYSQASMIYSEAIDLQPDNAVLYCNRSMAYLKQDMPTEALADAERSLQIDASIENIKAYWRRAQALLELERLEDSEAAAEEGMALQAGNSHLNRVRRKAREAIALRRLGGGEWEGQMQNGIEKRLSFSTDGTMTMSLFGHSVDATFDLSVECDPQVMHIKMKPDGAMNGSGPPPPPIPYIYEFHDDGKELWLCHPVGTVELPTKFEGAGFDRMRRASSASAVEEATTELLEVRCGRYMRELSEAMPLIPPQLPARPSDEDINEEAILMEMVSKLRRHYGMPVHQRALELAKAPHLAGTPEISDLALQLQQRFLVRRILSKEDIEKPKQESPPGQPPNAASRGQQLNPAPLKPAKLGSCLAGIAERFCHATR